MGPARSGLAAIIAIGCVLGWGGCGPSLDEKAGPSLAPEPIANAEDAVCGMLVREQPAPRAQAVHRDGTRVYFCSLGDLMAHLSAPSPHGKVHAIFVEVLEPDEDPTQVNTQDHEWIVASDAVFVVGVPRTGIMGAPVLVYRDAAEASSTLARWPDTKAMDLSGLRAWWAGTLSAR
jgi:nitrous oxide reductase accessory protein NosL